MKQMTLILFMTSFLFIEVSVHGALTEEQTSRLISAAWQTPPESMDIAYFLTEKNIHQDEQQIRQMYKQSLEDIYGSREELNSFQRNQYDRTLEVNVQRMLTEQKTGRKSKVRVRYSGDKFQRVDRVDAIPPRTIFKDNEKEEQIPAALIDEHTPHHISVIERRDATNIIQRHEYNHQAKTVRSQPLKHLSPIYKSEVPGFMLMPMGIRTLLKAKAGDHRENGDWAPNDLKVDKLQNNCLPGILIEIEPNPQKADGKVELEIQICNNNQQPYLKNVIVCDQYDYSKVYSFEAYLTATNTLIRKENRGQFDAQGFPHHVTLIEYNGQTGDVRYHKEYTISNVQVNPSIPDKTFDCNLPQDYKLLSFPSSAQSGNVSEQQNTETDEAIKILKTNDVDQISVLLSHPDWEIRALSLRKMKSLINSGSQELSTIAETMKNDNHPAVRKIANAILNK